MLHYLYMCHVLLIKERGRDPHLFSLPMYFYTPLINLLMHLSYRLYYILLAIFLGTYF